MQSKGLWILADGHTHTDVCPTNLLLKLRKHKIAVSKLVQKLGRRKQALQVEMTNLQFV